ncbi:MAG: PEP-CTERM sorting domain-containing protein [Planctomycetota bacterium]
MKNPNTMLILAAGVALTASQTAMAQYVSGDSWHRSTDWVPGSVAGSTANNPGPGFDGVGVWQYEYSTGGGGLTADTPWYASDTTMLTWDDNWWNHGFGAWTKGDDAGTPIRQDRMTHNLTGSYFDEAPIVRWLMPSGTSDMRVDINGQFEVLWTGNELRGTSIDVDLVIARETADGIIDVLFSDTLAKPTLGISVGDTATSVVDLSEITLAEGDSLIFSGRGVSGIGWTEGRWMAIQDDLTISVNPIPAPASLALLGLGGMAAARRRR